MLPALLSGIRTLTTLWDGFKAGEEISNRFFSGEIAKHIAELRQFYGNKNYAIESYYKFGNPYNLPKLRDVEFGCSTSQVLSCGTPDVPVLFPMGFIVALDYAARDLQSSLSTEIAFKYTRPVQHVRRAERWEDINNYGKYFKTEMQYYSILGSVGLRWLIMDPKNHISVAEYRIRDDSSNKIVAEGRTPQFAFL